MKSFIIPDKDFRLVLGKELCKEAFNPDTGELSIDHPDVLDLWRIGVIDLWGIGAITGFHGAERLAVRDLSGIEYFPELRYLHLMSQPIKEINLEKNINLSELSLYDTEMSEIDITKNIKLASIFMAENRYLKNIRIYGNPWCTMHLERGIKRTEELIINQKDDCNLISITLIRE